VARPRTGGGKKACRDKLLRPGHGSRRSLGARPRKSGWRRSRNRGSRLARTLRSIRPNRGHNSGFSGPLVRPRRPSLEPRRQLHNGRPSTCARLLTDLSLSFVRQPRPTTGGGHPSLSHRFASSCPGPRWRFPTNANKAYVGCRFCQRGPPPRTQPGAASAFHVAFARGRGRPISRPRLDL